MDERAESKLGPPDFVLLGFQLWVHGYQFPESTDAWDGNWLRVTAHCGAKGASVWVSGSVLDTASFHRFGQGLGSLHATLRGEAVLESHEPNVLVRVTAANRSGQVRIRVELTPDHMTQKHAFEFDADQSYLPPVISQCRRLLERLPIRDAAGRGV